MRFRGAMGPAAWRPTGRATARLPSRAGLWPATPATGSRSRATGSHIRIRAAAAGYGQASQQQPLRRDMAASACASATASLLRRGPPGGITVGTACRCRSSRRRSISCASLSARASAAHPGRPGGARSAAQARRDRAPPTAAGSLLTSFNSVADRRSCSNVSPCPSGRWCSPWRPRRRGDPRRRRQRHAGTTPR